MHIKQAQAHGFLNIVGYMGALQRERSFRFEGFTTFLSIFRVFLRQETLVNVQVAIFFDTVDCNRFL